MSDGISEPPSKKKIRKDKLEEYVDNKNSTVQVELPKKEDNDELLTLDQFEIVRVINSSESSCNITVEAKVKGKDGVAVVTLQKLPFVSENINDYFSSSLDMRSLFHNDIYYNKMTQLPCHLNEVKASIIFPAEEKHIKKFEKDYCSFIHETPDLYKAVTYPFINSGAFNKQWIYNILEHKKEKDRIVCEDMDEEIGFVLVPDLKWSGEQNDDLYLQAIVMRRDISSIRDLRAKHIPLLKNVYSKCTATIKEKYGLAEHQLRAYFHYQPSFYHLHIHFSALTYDAPGISLGKSHHIMEVISNLSIDGDFYAKAVIPFTIKDCHPLRDSFDKYGYFSSKQNNGAIS